MKPIRCALLVPLALAAVELAAQSGNPLPKVSPFGSAAGPAAAAATAPEAIEFWGVTSIGKQTDLIFRNKTAKKSSWIAKGETKDGITVLNYDAEKEQAVVRIDGVQKVLSLKKATTSVNVAGMTPLPAGFNVPAATPAIASAPPPASVPAPSTTPPAPQTEIQRQETEARMLVSDLLEIGMAQRKAYEEAQRKAAEAAVSAPVAETPAKQP
ncbi:MAG: hypothetical protein JNL39_19655 [Opitutaceae bacterium]|nr:hypothetical protein [Opitutaceae bacterium]